MIKMPVTVMSALVLMSSMAAFADSTVIEGPGVRVQQSQGWFGRKSAGYEDALGNRVEQSTGLFGRQSTHTKVFGTEAVVSPRETTVLDQNGKPLITSRKTWFHGKETRIDGNSIMHSFKDLFGQ